jgi:hypothetical protein
VLLRKPGQVWKLSELAQVSGVSIGHVSNVRSSLIDREWADLDPHGLRLTAPNALLDAWSLSYETPALRQQKFYTALHGPMFEKALREVFVSFTEHSEAALASFSAAQWIAPYGRTHTQYLYVSEVLLEPLAKALHLSSPQKGENVVVWIPKDQGVYFDSFEAAKGIRCTSPLQTYLDLMQSGERGQEAADHLRKTRLAWTV